MHTLHSALSRFQSSASVVCQLHVVLLDPGDGLHIRSPRSLISIPPRSGLSTVIFDKFLRLTKYNITSIFYEIKLPIYALLNDAFDSAQVDCPYQSP